jgi:16S rRNA (cytosine967-C5)-methyltransferase
VKAAPARRCAYAVIRGVFERDAYADRLLRSRAQHLDARDRRLALQLSYGAIQRRLTLDHVIERLAERSLRRIDAPLLAALRLGAYELLYLHGAPDHAVVADCVQLAKTHSNRGEGLVNAILRRAAREGTQILQALTDGTPQQAAIKHSHPLWLAQLWWQQLGGEQARALMICDNQPDELALRVNTSQSSVASLAQKLSVKAHTDPLLAEALVLDEGLDLYSTTQWRAGAFSAQSRAAMLVCHVVDPQPGEHVLDLCAAPGGKSTHLAALMRGQGEVLAVERDPRRALELRGAIQRLGATNVRVQIADASKLRLQGATFDRVLVDPPCSGLGTLQAHPELRWRMTPQKIGQMTQMQKAILEQGAAALRPGGVLVYSTCTISSVENERQIETFLQRHSDFSVDDLTDRLACVAHPAATARGMLLTLPHRHRTAGFFIARLRKS